MTEEPDLEEIPEKPNRVKKIVKANATGDTSRYPDIEIPALDKLERELKESFEAVDPAWFLTEETRRTRERYLYLCAACVLFLLTTPGDFRLSWPVTVSLQILARWPLDLSFICVCLGIGANYLISARSELAQHQFNWELAMARADKLSLRLVDFRDQSEKLIKSKRGDNPYAPPEVKVRLREIRDRAKKSQPRFEELRKRNESIAWWGNWMPYLTFLAPLLLVFAAFAWQTWGPPPPTPPARIILNF